MSHRTSGPARGKARDARYDALTRELRELCRTHDITTDLLEDSRSLDDLLGRTLAEAERHWEAGAERQPGSADEEAKRLRGLLLFARRTHALRESAEERERGRELRRLDDRVQRVLAARTTSRREGLDRLAEHLRALSSLTHKINNPLTSLLGRIQILHLRQKTDPGVLKAVEVIDESARRVADHVRQVANTVKQCRDEVLQRLLALEQDEPDDEDLTP